MAMRGNLSCWRVDELSVFVAQLCLCLRGRRLLVAAIKTAAAAIPQGTDRLGQLSLNRRSRR